MTKKKPKELLLDGGRPSKYEPRFDQMAFNHCLLGATDDSLARLFSVDVTTINEWKKVHPTFSQSIWEGKDGADEAIAKSMYHRAKGMKKKVPKVLSYNGQHTETIYVEEDIPPDPTCALFWLKNRHGKFWREKQEVDSSMNINVNYVEAKESDADNSSS